MNCLASAFADYSQDCLLSEKWWFVPSLRVEELREFHQHAKLVIGHHRLSLLLLLDQLEIVSYPPALCSHEEPIGTHVGSR